MLLLWLLVVPTVHGDGSIQCQSACGLCAIDNNPVTASCKLCRECHKVHRRMTGVNNTPGLNNRQKNQLKNLEMKEFKEVMREYGWEPKDFTDNYNGNKNNENEATEEVLDDDHGDVKMGAVKGQDTKNKCIAPPSTCINDEEYDEMMNIFPNKKLSYKSPQMCKTPSTTTCLPVDPCKRPRAGKRLQGRQSTSSTVPPILRHIETLIKNNNKDDPDCPTQQESSDYDDTDKSITATECLTKEPYSPKKLMEKITTEASTHSCMPCMPLCPLPCSMQLPQNSLLPSIPQEALEALMTLKPTKMTNQKLIFSPNEEKKEEPIQPINEITSAVLTEATKNEHITSSTAFIEVTTKDYVYLYVGVPKDVNIRRG